MMITKLLAYEYRYKVRFAFVDILKRSNEKLKETFEVYTVPTNFFCKPNDENQVICYEMHANSISYKEIRDFIEDKYLDESY